VANVESRRALRASPAGVPIRIRGHEVKALIIIPTYDERENLVELLAPGSPRTCRPTC
jgi:hypothetical protein